MKNINNYVVLTVFFYSRHVSCYSILNITSDRFEVYRDIMTEILTKCHPDYGNIIFYDDCHQNYQFESKILSPAYMRINSSTAYKYHQIEKIKKTTRIDAVIMTIYRVGFVRDFMVALRSLQLLDITTPFYIFSRLNKSYANRKIILEIAWELKLLSTLFICLSPTDVPLIYAFNPYGSDLPKQWSLVPALNTPNNSFHMFKRMYKKGNLCPGLDFDCTLYSNNTLMKLGFELDIKQRVNKRLEWKAFSHELVVDEMFKDKIILQLLKKSMNIGYEGIFINFDTLPKRGYDKALKKAYDLEVDLILFNDEVIGEKHFTLTYPFRLVEYTIIGFQRAYQNLFERTYYIFGFAMLIVMAILIILTFFVIWLSNREKTIAFAFFEILRLLINASLLARMDTASLKIFFMVVLFYFMIIQTLFQGELANFFTKPIHKQFPMSIEHLESLEYKPIYCVKNIKDYVDQFEYLRENVKYLKYPEQCADVLFTTLTSVCILEKKDANFLEIMSYWRQSPAVHSQPKFYIARDNSPIKHRLNKAFLQLWELGFSSKISNDEDNTYMGYIQRRTAKFTFEWRPIRNVFVRPMYTFLGVGLSLATLCFIVELIIYNCKKNRKGVLNNKKTSLIKSNIMRIMVNILRRMIRRYPFNNEEK